jgi:hypothetical protein
VRVQVAQEELVELEARRELPLDVVHGLQELVEHGTRLFDMVVSHEPILHAREQGLCDISAATTIHWRQEELLARKVATPVQKSMSKAHEVLLY